MQFAGTAIDQGTRKAKPNKCHELQLSVVEDENEEGQRFRHRDPSAIAGGAGVYPQLEISRNKESGR